MQPPNRWDLDPFSTDLEIDGSLLSVLDACTPFLSSAPICLHIPNTGTPRGRMYLRKRVRDRHDYADADTFHGVDMLFEPMHLMRRISATHLHSLHIDQQPASRLGLMSFFAVACDTPGTLQLAQRSGDDIRRILSVRQTSAVRCERHGPFACSCFVLLNIGAALRTLCHMFCEEVSDASLGVSFEDGAFPSDGHHQAELVHVFVNAHRQVFIACQSACFPFHEHPYQLTADAIVTLTRWDSVAAVADTIRRGWHSGESGVKHIGLVIPRCYACSAASAVGRACSFCPERFCCKCTSLCESCNHYRCCSACTTFGSVGGLPVRHCPTCAEHLDNGFFATGNGDIILLAHS